MKVEILSKKQNQKTMQPIQTTIRLENGYDLEVFRSINEEICFCLKESFTQRSICKSITAEELVNFIKKEA